MGKRAALLKVPRTLNAPRRADKSAPQKSGDKSPHSKIHLRLSFRLVAPWCFRSLLLRSNRHEDRFARRWRREGDFGRRCAECADRIANRFAHRNGQHQRWFSDRLAPVNDVGLSRALQKSNMELPRRVAERRNLVSVRVA